MNEVPTVEAFEVPFPKLAEVVRLVNKEIKMSGQDVEGFCTADWHEGQDHQDWLNTATAQEIADWVIAGSR